MKCPGKESISGTTHHSHAVTLARQRLGQRKCNRSAVTELLRLEVYKQSPSCTKSSFSLLGSGRSQRVSQATRGAPTRLQEQPLGNRLPWKGSQGRPAKKDWAASHIPLSWGHSCETQGSTTPGALQAAFQRSCAKGNAFIFPEPQGTGVWYLPEIPLASFYYFRLAQARGGTCCHAAQGAQGKHSHPQESSTFLSYCNPDPSRPWP